MTLSNYVIHFELNSTVLDLQVWIDLSAVHSHVALSKIEIFVAEDPGSQRQAAYVNSDSSSWIATEDEVVETFEIDEVCFIVLR